MSAPSTVPGASGKPERPRPSPRAYWRAFRQLSRRGAEAGQPGAMTVLEHLEELRVRVLKSLIALTVTTLVSLLYAEALVDFLTVPLGGRSALASIEVTENISIFMRVTLLSGLVLGMPLVLHQLIAYLAPGLQPRERRWLYWLLPAATIFFLAGVAFAWLIMVPVSIPFLVNFLGIPTHPRPLNYVGFITSLLFWVGLAFEMPLVVFFLAKLKLVTARQLVRGWRYAFMGIATLAALITPTVDPVNMALVTVPLLGLYALSIILARLA
ncbi:MAG: twin-arginine translocase subunit TatC [Anaerolineales bacterium]|nr:twin-arginine translocase subunit TatC [Anaerolineales bacterium]